jgi:F-type H+-transporting ATPase subunit epsilon
MRKFKLEVLTPEKQFLSEEVEGLLFTTPDGQLMVLKGHAPMVAAVSAGEVQIKQEGEWKMFMADEGYLEVRPDEVLLFSQSCLWPEEIDVGRAEEALRRAQGHIADINESVSESRRHKVALVRAVARLRVAAAAKHEEKKTGLTDE